VNRSQTVNWRELEDAYRAARLDVLVAASCENILYLSGAPIASVLGIERIALIVWEPATDPTFIVCNIDESQARTESWIGDIRAYREFAETPIQLLASVLRERQLESARIGVEKAFLTAAQQEELAALLPGACFVDCGAVLDTTRAIKTEPEIALLRGAAHLAEEAIQHGFQQARVGMSEKALLNSMLAAAVQRGGLPSGPVLSSGIKTSHAHAEADAKPLEVGDLVRVDFCGFYEGYWYDLARTAVVGRATPEQRDIYARLWHVQRTIIASMAPGVPACEVFNVARKACEKERLPLGFPHVGHNLGIGIHESPLMQPSDRTPLRTNMTICIEPVYQVPGVGGYHIEDLVRVTEGGCEILSDLYDTAELPILGAQSRIGLEWR
jgi:Xaa-Pro aminopeptidase